MASVAERLAEVADQLTDVEHKWLEQGVPSTNIARIAVWRDVVLEAAYALNTGRHRTVSARAPEPKLIGTRAMEQTLRDLRWKLTPREYQEYVHSGALYNSVMESIIDGLLEHGYDIVKHG